MSRGRGASGLERRSYPVLSRGQFAARMARVVAVWFGLAAIGLVLGMAGYALTEGMSLVDSFLNAAMILSGMGPVSELKTNAGKIFAGVYAIFSGLFIVVATGFVLAPLLHRVMHILHVGEDDDDDNDPERRADDGPRKAGRDKPAGQV